MRPYSPEAQASHTNPKRKQGDLPDRATLALRVGMRDAFRVGGASTKGPQITQGDLERKPWAWRSAQRALATSWQSARSIARHSAVTTRGGSWMPCGARDMCGCRSWLKTRAA